MPSETPAETPSETPAETTAASALTSLLELVRGGADEHAGVIDAALSAFLDFGIRRSSMNEIARRAGISPATLYRRFAQKSDLVLAVGVREVRRFVAEVDRAVDPRASAQDQIAEQFVAFLTALRRNKLLLRLLDTEPETVLPVLTIRGEPILMLGRDYIADFIHRLQRAGSLPAFDAEPVAEMVARIALSMLLTPQTSIPLRDEAAARQFAREHITVLFRLV
jgi:AcrR family transcriptional regulator